MDTVWKKIHSSRDWGKWPNEELVRFIGRNFFRMPRKQRKKIRILEVGVGQGANTWFMMKEGFDVYGVDISCSAIDKFKKMFSEENLEVEDFSRKFKVADIREIPFGDRFDVVIDCATVWYVTYTEHHSVYKEINRVLKKGGLFFS